MRAVVVRNYGGPEAWRPLTSRCRNQDQDRYGSASRPPR
jgi:hypothetical protein